MNDKEFLGKRRDRAIATILSHKEREIDQFLPDYASTDLRKVILDNINDLIDCAFDMIGHSYEFNEVFFDQLDRYFSEE